MRKKKLEETKLKVLKKRRNNIYFLENLKRTLIFVNLRSNVYKLTRYLQKNDINADGIERY